MWIDIVANKSNYKEEDMCWSGIKLNVFPNQVIVADWLIPLLSLLSSNKHSYAKFPSAASYYLWCGPYYTHIPHQVI